MKNTKSLFILLLLFWGLLPFGTCSATQAQDQTQVIVSIDDWTTLQENNNAQLMALQKSEEALQIARNELKESNENLQTARNELEQSRAELKTLQTELKAQQDETQRLRKQLIQQQEKSTNVSNSIEAAQKYLNDTREEIWANEKAHAKTEKELKNKITAWQIVAVIIGGIAICK